MVNDTPINDLIQEYIDSVDKADSTKNLYQKTLNYFVTWMVKNDRDIKQPASKDVATYKSSLKDSGLSPATIDNYLASVKNLFGWLSKEYKVNNPTEYIKRERNRNRVYIRQCLTIDQVYKLIGSIPNDSLIHKRNRAIITLMSFQGVRCCEVKRLNCGDFRQSSEKTWFLQIQRKGAREAGDVIRITEETLNSINEYLNSRSDEIDDKTPMFISHGRRNNNKRFSVISISKMVKASLRNIGLDGREYCAHSLRHTFASLAQLAGSEVYEIQYSLGHADVNETERYLKSLGRSIGAEGTAILKIQEMTRKYKQSHNKQNLSEG